MGDCHYIVGFFIVAQMPGCGVCCLHRVKEYDSPGVVVGNHPFWIEVDGNESYAPVAVGPDRVRNK